MEYRFEKDVLADLDRALTLEWLESNGIGGWASSTVHGVNTRRYHGLLVAALRPPVGRSVLISRMDEQLKVGGKVHRLAFTELDDGSFVPNEGQHLICFEKQTFPSFIYKAGDVQLKKTVVACHGENTTLVLYEVLKAAQPLALQLTPLFAGRDYHYETRADDHARMPIKQQSDNWCVETGPGLTQTWLQVPGAVFERNEAWVRGIAHRLEAYRGLGHREDLFRSGTFTVTLAEGARLGVILSDHNPSGRDAWELLEREQARREQLISGSSDAFEAALRLAADQFVVARGEKLKTIIAGYHWFTDWGRDTMIALPGLCLSTGQFDTAKRIIQAFAAHISQGMIPNRFPDAGDEPEYNTVDATLWMFVALLRYLEASGDLAFVRELYPKLKEIIEWHQKGTRYNIQVCEDGLLAAGEHGTQLTWMDAKVGDWVVTPRQGKAVEINALWYNALQCMHYFAKALEQPDDAPIYEAEASRVKIAFGNLFWNEQAGCLFDCVEGDRKDASIRPNQLFAISLPFALLNAEQSRRVLAVVEAELVTPVGLRSLAPSDAHYRGWYGGDQVSRDGAYHQGTVWSWLAGPYLEACLRVLNPVDARVKAEVLFSGLREHMSAAGIGSISEVFDGDAPHAPRGCIAQAWGVAELLRMWLCFKELDCTE